MRSAQRAHKLVTVVAAVALAVPAFLVACGGDDDAGDTAATTVGADETSGGMIEVEPASEEGLSAEDLEFNKGVVWDSILVISEARDVTPAEAARDYICQGKEKDLAYSDPGNVGEAGVRHNIENFKERARETYCP